MKKCIQLLLMFALVCFWATSASALSLDIVGMATFEDADNNEFRETVSFSRVQVWDADPDDSLLKDATIVLSTIYLDENNPYSFDPTIYANGFQLLDSEGMELLVADWEVLRLEDINTHGLINSNLVGNLYNITQGSHYTLGTSTIIDALLNDYNPGGAMSISTNFEVNVSDFIYATGAEDVSFSGIIVPTPEPGTLLLLGSGLAGLAAARRRKKA